MFADARIKYNKKQTRNDRKIENYFNHISNYIKVIVNFAKHKKLLFLSAKYMELSEIEKKKFSIEMLSNIYETDFNDENINNTINQNLLIFDYVYSLKI